MQSEEEFESKDRTELNIFCGANELACGAVALRLRMINVAESASLWENVVLHQ